MEPYYEKQGIVIYHGNAATVLRELPDQSVHCCVTSPPYWGLRDYSVDGQLGLEPTPEEYVENMVEVFREVKRVLRDDGTLWLNLGDSYNSGSAGTRDKERWPKQADNMPLSRIISPTLKTKDLAGVPWRVALALQADGWYLRQDIIWAKPNPMPESVRDRCTKSHEYIFLLSKSKRYYFDSDAIAEPCVESNDARPRMGQGSNTRYKQKRQSMKMPDGWDTDSGSHGAYHRKGREKGKANNADMPEKRIKRSVWTVPPQICKEAHFATFPEKLIEPCILAGCPEGGTVLDPFLGSGTTGYVARNFGRKCIGIELNEEYFSIIRKRLEQSVLNFTE